MSKEYSRVSTVDDGAEEGEEERLAASPASGVGKKLLKDAQEKQSFKEMVKADFWSNVS